MNLYLTNPLIIFLICFFGFLIFFICVYLVNERINRLIVTDITERISIINSAHV